MDAAFNLNTKNYEGVQPVIDWGASLTINPQLTWVRQGGAGLACSSFFLERYILCGGLLFSPAWAAAGSLRSDIDIEADRHGAASDRYGATHRRNGDWRLPGAGQRISRLRHVVLDANGYPAPALPQGPAVYIHRCRLRPAIPR